MYRNQADRHHPYYPTQRQSSVQYGSTNQSLRRERDRLADRARRDPDEVDARVRNRVDELTGINSTQRPYASTAYQENRRDPDPQQHHGRPQQHHGDNAKELFPPSRTADQAKGFHHQPVDPQHPQLRGPPPWAPWPNLVPLGTRKNNATDPNTVSPESRGLTTSRIGAPFTGRTYQGPDLRPHGIRATSLRDKKPLTTAHKKPSTTAHEGDSLTLDQLIGQASGRILTPSISLRRPSHNNSLAPAVTHLDAMQGNTPWDSDYLSPLRNKNKKLQEKKALDKAAEAALRRATESLPRPPHGNSTAPAIMDPVATHDNGEGLNQPGLTHQEAPPSQFQAEIPTSADSTKGNTMHEQAATIDEDIDMSNADIAVPTQMKIEERVSDDAEHRNVQQMADDPVQIEGPPTVEPNVQAPVRKGRKKRRRKSRKSQNAMNGCVEEWMNAEVEGEDERIEEDAADAEDEFVAEAGDEVTADAGDEVAAEAGDEVTAEAGDQVAAEAESEQVMANENEGRLTRESSAALNESFSTHGRLSPISAPASPPPSTPTTPTGSEALAKCKAYEQVIARLGTGYTQAQLQIKSLSSMVQDPASKAEMEAVSAGMATGSNLALRYLREYPATLARLRPYSNGQLKDEFVEYQVNGMDVDR
ncbi:MAG: hypothetical protein Q9168_002852 [Polycauliona sp. 1 TL-2023]